MTANTATIATDIQDALAELITTDNGDLINTDTIRTFTEAGVFTTNAGLVLRTADGSEFQISIVQSA